MITTLIVDDNKIMREYFQTMIDWEAKGFDLVAIASNGVIGWQEFNAHHPQLVITDVQMPGMTGLELARMIKDTAPDTIIVFISNYEDFNYVKGAMDIGAYDYILKHETRGAKFNEKLEKIRTDFEKYSRDKRNYLESKLILAFSSSGIPDLSKYLPDRYDFIVFEQASILPPFVKLTNLDINEIDENLFQSYFSKHTKQLICGIRIKQNRYAVLLKANSDTESFANELSKYIYSQTKVFCYAMTLAKNQNIDVCRAAYFSYQDMMNTKFFYKHDLFIQIADTASTQSKDSIINENKILNAASQADIDKTCEILDYYSHSIIKNKNYDQLCHLVSILLNFMVQNSNGFAKSGFVLYNNNDMKFWTNANEIFFWLKNKLIQLLTSIKQSPAFAYSQPVRVALDYISENYPNSELSIGSIAKYVGLDQNKLNKIMKDETGLTAIKWLTKIRIDKAKELLMQNKKLTQIYSDVGYSNISYFSNVFKKVCGVTPLEYRRNNLEKETKV